jgi:hypothetical protein
VYHTSVGSGAAGELDGLEGGLAEVDFRRGVTADQHRDYEWAAVQFWFRFAHDSTTAINASLPGTHLSDFLNGAKTAGRVMQYRMAIRAHRPQVLNGIDHTLTTGHEPQMMNVNVALGLGAILFAKIKPADAADSTIVAGLVIR